MPYFYPFIILIDSSTPLASRQKPSLAQAFLLGCYVSLTGANLPSRMHLSRTHPTTPGCSWGPSRNSRSFPTSPMTQRVIVPPTPPSFILQSLSKQHLHPRGNSHIRAGEAAPAIYNHFQLAKSAPVSERGLFCFCQGYSGAKDHQRQGMV